MSKKVTRHNEFILKILGNPQLATSFLQTYMPADIRADTDFSQLTLSRLNTESVSDNLDRRYIADILFKVPIKSKTAYLLFHIEHQSTYDDLTLLRANQYGLNALIDYKRLHPKEPLPPLLTFIYYHNSQSSGNHPTQMADLLEDSRYAQYLLQPLFIDITRQSDEELLQHGQIGAIELVLKHINDAPSAELANQLFTYLEIVDSETQYHALQYIASRLELDNKLLLEQALKHFDEDTVMNAAEQLRQQGEQRGMQKGMQKRDIDIARHMLFAKKRKYDVEEIADITGLDKKEIERLKNEQE